MTDNSQLKRDLWTHLSDSPFIMMSLVDKCEHSEPLTAQLDKDQVNRIYFFMGKGNRIASGGRAMGQFVSKGHDYFACLAGSVEIDHDPAMIDKLWSKKVEAWFPSGKNDPELALLRFDIDNAELWGTDSSFSGKLKMLFGGNIKIDETGGHAKVGTTAA